MKTIKINTCSQCPYFLFKTEPETFKKIKETCILMGERIKTKDYIIPTWCPLEDCQQRDQEVQNVVLPLYNDLVVVSHWSDFDLNDAVFLGKFKECRGGYFYIQNSGRGFKYCRKVSRFTFHD